MDALNHKPRGNNHKRRKPDRCSVPRNERKECRIIACNCHGWHGTNPIRFHKDLEVTIQAPGRKQGRFYDPLEADFASAAYRYQKEPHESFSPLPSLGQLDGHKCAKALDKLSARRVGMRNEIQESDSTNMTKPLTPFQSGSAPPTARLFHRHSERDESHGAQTRHRWFRHGGDVQIPTRQRALASG